MPIKETGDGTDLQEIDRWEHGVGWLAYPGEQMQRASHAIEVDGEVWIVDPVETQRPSRTVTTWQSTSRSS
jgi:hypothetical protein